VTRIAVIGAGPAGLWAARRAQRAGHEVVVHERADHVGGMAASFDVAGVRVDNGSHRLHPATDPAILRELQGLVPLQWRPRNGRIRLLGRWLRFPLRPTDLVRHLPKRIALDAVVHSRTERADTYADVVRARFGPAMLEHFYGPFARKLWGLEPDELSGEQARRRISASSPLALARKVLQPGERPGFWYPERGFGAIVDAIAREVGDIRLESDVSSLADLDADLVWSTIPLPALARLAGDGPDTSLRFRALVLVYLVLDRRPWTTFDAHYLPGPETALTRASEVLNYRDSIADPTDRTVLCCELPCAIGDAHWTMSDADLGALAADGLGVDGVVDVVVKRLPAAYPIYDRGFERDLATLESWLDGRPDLLSFGRGGLFAHDNTHHALAEGEAAAACLRPDGTWDADGWRAARARFARHVVED
jgi:protoporphyrinogen oxidase